nr:nop-like protein [Cryptomonas sp.]
MLNYISKTKAIDKLGISGKIFDWICYLNGISGFCPRQKQKGKKKVYFILKDLKKIKCDGILFKIKQVEAWKSALKDLKHKKEDCNISLILKNIPFYNFDVKFKEKFFSFNNTFIQFKSVFSFILLVTNQVSEDISYTKFIEKFNLIKKKFLNFLTSINTVKKIFYTKESIQLQFKMLGRDINVIVPRKKIVSQKKKFDEILSEHYISLSSFVLRKFIFFYNYKYVNCNYTNVFNIYNSVVSFSKRNYKYQKRKIEPYDIFHISKKYQKIYQLFKISTFDKCSFINIYWTCSKDTKIPEPGSILKNPIFHIQYNNHNYLFIFFLKCLTKKCILDKNNNKVTHIICQRIEKNYSLTCHTIKLNWIIDTINSRSSLPILFNQEQYLENNNTNPFYTKMNRKNTSHLCIRNAFGGKKIELLEFFDMQKITWIFNIKKTKKKRMELNIVKMIIVKAGSVFI